MNNTDLISRSALLEGLRAPLDYLSLYLIRKIVNGEPAVDAVKVVRCKDCVHWIEERTDLSIRTGICKMTSKIVSCVFYCACGVKMDAEDN